MNSTDPIPYDPCDVDLGVLSGIRTYTVASTSPTSVEPLDDSLMWNITTVKGGPWLKPRNLHGGSTSRGVLAGGKIVHVEVNVAPPISARCSIPGVYVAKLSVNCKRNSVSVGCDCNL